MRAEHAGQQPQFISWANADRAARRDRSGMNTPPERNAPTVSDFRMHAEPDKVRTARACDQGGAAPVMIRAYCGVNKGATAFFRNRCFLAALVAELGERCPRRPRVFFHACSVGAEPYSFAIWCLNEHERTGRHPPLIVATDIAPAFLSTAREALYPRSVVEGMTDAERRWFEPVEGGQVRVAAAVRELVSFVPPQSFLEPAGGGAYDAVLAMNALTYVTPAEQTLAVRSMAGDTRHLLGLTAFHPDTIRADLEAVGFEPVLARQREIHAAWGDRCVGVLPPVGAPEYSWQLPPFDTVVPDREYRFGALFARRSGT
jgi:hypothetical protein